MVFLIGALLLQGRPSNLVRAVRHGATTVLAYAYGDSTTNLIQPFWAIPIVTVTRVRFGDVLGYMGLVAIACFAISMIAMYVIPATL